MTRILAESRTKKRIITLETVSSLEKMTSYRVKEITLHDFRSEENARNYFEKTVHRPEKE